MALVSEEYLEDYAFGYIRQNISLLFPENAANQPILSVDAFETIKFIVLEYAFEEWSPSQVVELIREAEKAERYEDMCKFVRKLVHLKSAKGEDLDKEERNLLSVAYKNAVGSKRTSWRTLAGGVDSDDVHKKVMKKYMAIIEVEMEEICKDVLSLLTDHLIKNVADDDYETKTFYLKMCGDYYRYLCEFTTEPEDKVKELKCKTEEYYTKAMDLAEAKVYPAFASRLGVALNFSVCLYEILGEPEKACALAKRSFDAALEKMDFLSTPSWASESNVVLKLLSDNLSLWTSTKGDGDDQ